MKDNLHIKTAFIGFLIGLFFPVLALLVLFTEGEFSGVLDVHKTHKLLWIIDLAPLILGGVFGFFGWQHKELRAMQLQRSGRAAQVDSEKRKATLQGKKLELLHKARFVQTASLLLIGLLILTTFALGVWYEERQLENAHLINLAGRQRMLSQRIAKNALLKNHETSSASDNAAYSKEIEQMLRRLTTVHGILGASTPEEETEKAKAVGLALEELKSALRLGDIQALHAAEQAFLEAMEVYVLVFEWRMGTQQDEGVLFRASLTLMLLITLPVLGLIAFRPMRLQLKEAFATLSLQNAERKASEEEVRQIYAAQQETMDLLAKKTFSFRETNAELKGIRDALNRSVILSITDAKGKIIEVNSIFCEVAGYSEEELLGQDHRIVNSGYHSPKFWRKMWADLKKGYAWRAEVCNRKKNGKLYWVDSVMNPVYDESGKLHRILSIRYLITERKNMEERNKQQQIMLQAAEALTQIGTWRYDLNTGDFHISEGLKTMLFSREMERVSLEDFLNLTIPEDREQLHHSLEEAMGQLEHTYSFRVPAIGAQTGYPYRHIKAVTKVETKKGAVSEVLTTCQDITADFLAEKAIQESKKQVEKLLENTQSSIRYAKRIQQALLPPREDIEKHLDFFLLYKPRDIVSGDFYWFEKSARGTFIVVGDCTGHGVPGALMTMLGASALQEILRLEHLSSPGLILERMHDFVYRALQQDRTENQDGVELAICVIPHKNTTTLVYAGANLPLYYVEPSTGLGQPAKFHKVQPDRKGIGGHNKREEDQSRVFKTQILHTQPKTTFFLCSDGYQDQFGGQRGKKFMRRRLELQLYENAYLPLENQKEIHAQKIEDWMEGHKQVDDITLFGFRPKEA